MSWKRQNDTCKQECSAVENDPSLRWIDWVPKLFLKRMEKGEKKWKILMSCDGLLTNSHKVFEVLKVLWDLKKNFDCSRCSLCAIKTNENYKSNFMTNKSWKRSFEMKFRHQRSAIESVVKYMQKTQKVENKKDVNHPTSSQTQQLVELVSHRWPLEKVIQ